MDPQQTGRLVVRIQTKIAAARVFLIGRVARTLGAVLFFAAALSIINPSGTLLHMFLVGAAYVCALPIGHASFWITVVLAGTRATARLRTVLQLHAAHSEVIAGKGFFGRLDTWVKHYTPADRIWNITVFVACFDYAATESIAWALIIALLGVNLELYQIRKVIMNVP